MGAGNPLLCLPINPHELTYPVVHLPFIYHRKPCSPKSMRVTLLGSKSTKTISAKAPHNMIASQGLKLTALARTVQTGNELTWCRGP